MTTAAVTMRACVVCDGMVEHFTTTPGRVKVGRCANCGGVRIEPATADIASPTNYAGTGRSLSELESMHAMTADDLLMRSLYDTRSQLLQLRLLEQQAEALLRQRILDRGEKADRTASHDYEARLRPTPSYNYNLEVLGDLQKHVTADDFDAALAWVPPTEGYRKPSKTALNVLKKRGGDVERIIDQGVSDGPTTYKIEVSKRAKT